MTSDLDFFTKADQLSDLYREAAKHGRKLGTPANRGMFYGPDAPAHLKSALHPMPTIQEWQARLDRNEADPIISKYGAGFSILALYRSPPIGDHPNCFNHKVSDPDNPMLAKATPDELRILWDRFFHAFKPGTKYPPFSGKFTHALKVEAARRGVTIVLGLDY
jgi:hypothetical protein